MSIESNQQFLDQLTKHEGLRLTTYYCTAGKLTIGVGHNLEANPIAGISKGSKITKEQAMDILIKDVSVFAKQLDGKLPWWRTLDEPRQAVLLNMAFNMGVPTLMKFAATLKAIKGGDYAQASRNMLVSTWAKQVKGRARELSEQMKTGEWQS